MALSAAAFGAAGCGSGNGGDEGEGPSRAALDLARRCDLAAPSGGRPPASLFPPGLLPRDAFVFRWDGSGLAARARVVFPGPLLRAQRVVEANARALGLPVLFRETETFDAELDVQSGSEVIRFAFTASKGCPREVSEAAIRKLAGPG